MRFPVGRDILERAVKTFMQTAIALAVSDGLDWQDALSIDHWKGLATAGLAAAVSVVMSAVFSKIGKPGASADPAVGIEPK